MTCPHCHKPLRIEEIKQQLSPEEIEALWAMFGQSSSMEAKRRAESDRAKRSWVEFHTSTADKKE